MFVSQVDGNPTLDVIKIAFFETDGVMEPALDLISESVCGIIRPFRSPTKTA